MKMKKVITCLMASALLAGTLVGCGNNAGTANKEASSAEKSSEQKVESSSAVQSSESVQEEVGVTYPMEEDVKLTIAIVEEAAVTASVKDISETFFGKAWEEATGVEIEVKMYADSTAMNLMFAGGDLPDIVWYQFNSYSGGAEKAVKDKVIEPLNDYMEYAPDLLAVLESNDYWYRSATTSEGEIIGFPFIRGDDTLLSSSGIMYRKDWLDELGLDTPSTLDEFYDTMVAFKEKKGAEYPFSPAKSWFFDRALDGGVLTSPFGLVNTSFYQVDGEVHYGSAEAQAKELLTFLNKMYNEGLLDPNFQSLSFNNMGANFMNGISGACISSTGSGIGNYMNAMKDDSAFDIAPGGSLVAKEGDKALYGQHDQYLTGIYAVITPNCKNKEAAVKFLNYGYTEEGALLFNYGIEGESYTMVNGEPTYTDVILNNPDGLSVTNARALYDRSWSAGPFVQDVGVLQVNVYPAQQEAVKIWADTDAGKYGMPSLSIADEDLAEYTRIMSDIKTYRNEMFIKFITGQESLDNFEAVYLKTLEEMGVDHVIELQQKALTLFYSK